jgi:hypothetical protein
MKKRLKALEAKVAQEACPDRGAGHRTVCKIKYKRSPSTRLAINAAIASPCSVGGSPEDACPRNWAGVRLHSPYFSQNLSRTVARLAKSGELP